MKRKVFVLLLISALSLLLVSCKKDKNIYFDSSDPLSLAPDISWALVTDPYVAFRKEENWQSEIEGHARKGDILMIKGKSFTSDGTWYFFDEGWLPESSISVFSNKYKAETAKSELK